MREWIDEQGSRVSGSEHLGLLTLTKKTALLNLAFTLVPSLGPVGIFCGNQDVDLRFWLKRDRSPGRDPLTCSCESIDCR